MSRGVWFSLGLIVGSLAYPCGLVAADLLHHRYVIYPED